MSTGNGTVLGATKIVDNGPDYTKYTLALMSEGYTAAEMPKWEADAQFFADYLFGEVPFSDPDVRCAINIYRIDVTSDESGADDPKCGDTGGGTKAKTYFDATFCAAKDVRRTMSFDTETALLVPLGRVPLWHMGLVIVNSSVDGGSGGAVPIMSTARDNWPAAAVHELGHSAFGLADEYAYYAGCDSDEEGHDYHLPIEPIEPNVTAMFGLPPDISVLKWASLVDPPGTQIPTTTNPDPDCTTCDSRTDNPVRKGTVGAFEGANYFHCRAYRPRWDCRMRNSATAFCAVCTDVIRNALAPFVQPTSVTLQSPTVAFLAEEGTTVNSAVSFVVDSCLDLTFWVDEWPERTDGGPEEFGGAPILDLPYGRTAESTGPGVRIAYVWITYQATAPGDRLTGTITVECNQTEQFFTVPITAMTIERTTVGVMLSLDKSASMLEPASGGGTKGEALQYAAEVFVDVIPDDDGIGVNSFATDAEYGTAIEVAGTAGALGPGRAEAREYIHEYEPVAVARPAGLTSIGDALEESDGRLVGPFEEFATVVFTDGMETAPKYLSEVAGLISSGPRIFAVGLGTPENLDPAGFATLCSGSGGQLLLTGAAVEGDTDMMLSKFFLTILAGVTNSAIVRDPEGYLAPNADPVRIDFRLTETDMSADVVLVTPVPSAVQFALETPAGDLIRPTTTVSGTTHVQGARNAFYRVTLPAVVGGQPARDGTWHALLRLDMEDWTAGDNAPLLYWYLQHHPSAVVNGLPYFLQVQARSNLQLVAHCLQDSYEPGAELRVRGVLTEYGLPVDGRATVSAEVTRPDGTAATLQMPEIEPGVFETLEIAHQTGAYHFHVLASGVTLQDLAFTREQLVTGFTYHGGDTPTTHETDDNDDWCRLLECVAGALTPETCERLCIDPDRLRRCLSRHCRDNGITASQMPAEIDPADIDLIRDAATRLGLISTTPGAERGPRTRPRKEGQ